jgi:predicted GIY-YIG superfamily endonuclease
MYFVYILRCSDGSYYVGHTDNLDLRVQRHNEGRGCTYTAERRPVELAWFETTTDAAAARARERQLKGWTRAKKAALISGNAAALKRA